MRILRLPLFLIASLFLVTACNTSESENEESENEEYDGPGEAARYWFDRTKDPALNDVPRGRMLKALQQADASKKSSNNWMAKVTAFGTWTERGPSSDAAGPSGNSRPNLDITAGRTRAILVDAADATSNTVFLGGISGGLWKTTNFTSAGATWIPVNDFFSNMSISGICQDPTNANTMYFCTGEAYYNGDGAKGDGVFKSTDHGVTWNQLASTTGSNYDYCFRILCDPTGKIYLSTRNGVFRSIDGGGSWTNITPTGTGPAIVDMELSNTGRLHITAGYFSTCTYRFTDIPGTVAAGTWTSPTSGFPTSSIRIELGCDGNMLYALASNSSYQVPSIFKSVDGGFTWAVTTGQPTSGWASGQAWYSLTCAIDPSNPNGAIVGGLDNYKTTDGGVTWVKISTWVGNTGQYVHADQHVTLWYDNGNKLIFGSDGGIFYSTDKGTTIRDRNTGIRIKQFYSCAVHPTTTNFFLAGAQDNGTHRLTGAGLGGSVEVTGGDGGFVHIDQDQPQYIFTSYVRNSYWRSADGGNTWSSRMDLSGNGQFINPTDYDNPNNIMYCGDAPGAFRRWTNPQTGSTSASVGITTLNANSVSCVTASTNINNRVYFGTTNDVSTTRLTYVDNANTIASGSAGVNISAGLPTNTYTSCLAIGLTDNNLMTCYSNYGVQQVWVSSNNGASWTNIDGNLPDMPVYWCMFVPGDNTKAIIATEAGVWVTDLINGASTVWFASPTFPSVRAAMLQYRAQDGLVVAASYGRGLWSQPLGGITNKNYYIFNGNGNWNVAANWNNGILPPASLAAGDQIFITPTTGGQCTLNVPYTLSSVGKIIVTPGKNFVVQGNLTLQ